MKQKIIKILIIFIFIFSFNINNSLAFSNTKINNFLDKFYLKLDKTNFEIKNKIEKLEILKAKVKYVRILKQKIINDDTKKILTYIENNLEKKIKIYKDMLKGSALGLGDFSLDLYKKLKKMGLSIKNCSSFEFSNNEKSREKCKNSIEKISNNLQNFNFKLKKSGVSIRNCVFGKIYYKFSHNKKYYEKCLIEKQKIKQTLAENLEGFNNLSDEEKSRYVTKILFKSIFFKNTTLGK